MGMIMSGNQEPAGGRDSRPVEPEPSADVAVNDPGPIEIDFVMKSPMPTLSDLLAEGGPDLGEPRGGDADIDG
jgi:hypothetical protein